MKCFWIVVFSIVGSVNLIYLIVKLWRSIYDGKQHPREALPYCNYCEVNHSYQCNHPLVKYFFKKKGKGDCVGPTECWFYLSKNDKKEVIYKAKIPLIIYSVFDILPELTALIVSIYEIIQKIS